MIHSLEEKTRKELVEIVKIQIQEYQNLHKVNKLLIEIIAKLDYPIALLQHDLQQLKENCNDQQKT